MSERQRQRITLVGLLCTGAAVLLLGINWGLPSRAVDPYLFGDQPVWSGQTIVQLAPADDGERGADVDVNPLVQRDRVIVVNETDAQRAEIIRRYRLFSYQPDEFITFKSLSRMKEHRGDPRLYQYGGLWIYPVGGLLKLASTIGFIDLRGGPQGQAYYLDHPEAFGRFYIVARFYVVLWALIGAWAVFWIARRMSGNLMVAVASASCYIFMPVVVNMAHEAKPHLPGTVLILLAVIAAAKYVETGATRWWIWSGVACGAAFAMVLSALLGFAIVPAMILLRPSQWPQRIKVMLLSGLIGIGVYLVTNPYVPINLLSNRQIIRSNLENSAAMYEPAGWAGLGNAIRLTGQGMSPPLAVVGAAGAVYLLSTYWNRHRAGCDGACPGRSDAGWLLAAPAALIFVQFMLLASGKPAEYARFALLPDIALAIAACVAAQSLLRKRHLLNIVLTLLVILTAWRGMTYVGSFVRDSQPLTSRLVAAQRLQKVLGAGSSELSASFEPAPFSLPPVDLFRWKILLPPRDQPIAPIAHIAVCPVDVQPSDLLLSQEHFGQRYSVEIWGRAGTPMSWADKAFFVLTQESPLQ